MILALTAANSINEWLLIGTIVAVCVLAFVIFDYYRSTQEYKRDTRALTDEIEKLKQETETIRTERDSNKTALEGISHEILTPINAIRTVVGMVDGEEVSNEIREYCDVLKISAQSLAHTANSVFGYTEEDIEESEQKMSGDAPRLIIPDAHIMVVDDNKVNIKVVTSLLNTFKADIVAVDNAYEAIDRIRNEEKFDIIFMDHLMPGMDGIEATKHIHELESEGSRTPVIALTANTGGDIEERFFNAGMCDFLAKPIALSQLERILKKWISSDKQKLVKSTEVVAEKGYEIYRPEKAQADYWSDYSLFKEVLMLFVRSGDMIVSRINDKPDDDFVYELTKFARYTRSIRATKLEKQVFELIESADSPDEDVYHTKTGAVSDEYARVKEAINSFIASKEA